MIECIKCNRILDEHHFYKNKNDEIPFRVCRECIKHCYDKDSLEQMRGLAEIYDIPWLAGEYLVLTERYKDKDLIFGRYLSKMKLASFKPFYFTDSHLLEDYNFQCLKHYLTLKKG